MSKFVYYNKKYEDFHVLVGMNVCQIVYSICPLAYLLVEPEPDTPLAAPRKIAENKGKR